MFERSDSHCVVSSGRGYARAIEAVERMTPVI